ncbi:PREDICTED: uncharacterized protein LOC108378994 [Rhagoletis zephyria]|uniref:uncharacterized protein LOC108378994 n=1 Tax=Rhagoletis zephyria TaxID=28612 RepID=UPI000811622B|nr:PREDICTED: uncharacterized protein LOC108378994 [Rhagoletis zephyria]
MFKHFFVVVVTVFAVLFLLGIYNINIEVEPNACQMTYMFEKPQFMRLISKMPNFELTRLKTVCDDILYDYQKWNVMFVKGSVFFLLLFVAELRLPSNCFQRGRHSAAPDFTS